MTEPRKDVHEVNIVQWPPTSWLDPIDITRTGLQTVLAGLFGSFADKREVLAALYPSDDKSPAFDYSKQDEVWFDYIADTGDGWNPTYSIACLVGDHELKVEGAERKLPRGMFMILGGDQVYPVASSDQYRNRLEGPFFCARVTGKGEHDRIPVYALPGNHDWYDGLTSFIRLFCQKDRWVGQWKATQTRSYFAIQLPHRWWIWGLDVQLESDLDVPQVNYFKHYAEFLKEGDRVILVTPEPTWIEAGRIKEETTTQAHRNMMHLERLILAKKATIPVKIAGDLHHYAHYLGDDKKSHLITCGGGGAFLHGTYGLPPELDLGKSAKQTFTRGQVVPSEDQSKAMRGSVMWNLLFRNPWFAVALGAVYWIYSWLLQSASEALDTLRWEEPTLLTYLRGSACPADQFLCANVFRAWRDIVLRDPLLFFFTGLIIVGCMVFAVVSRRLGSPGWKTVGVAILGFLHGVAHIVLALVLIKFAAGLISKDWAVHIATLFFGAVPGSLLMAAYLWLGNVILDVHDQEVLSTQGIENHKCFARFCVTKDAVTIYPIGLEKVCKKWIVADGIEPKTYKQRCFPHRRREYLKMQVPTHIKRIFQPAKPLRPRLLEPPIVV